MTLSEHAFKPGACTGDHAPQDSCRRPGLESGTAVRSQPALLTGFRREESETPSEQGARPEGTGGVLDGTSRSPTALDPARGTRRYAPGARNAP